MPAFDPPPAAAAPATGAAQPDVIEVVATRASETQKIDRRTYRVQQTPHAAQKDSYQLLRGIPAVTITPDQQIQVLGAANVIVQVDGREVRPEQLHNLHGSDIARIEVITNPSAQYSAQGTGGIINIALRQVGAGKPSGNVSVEASSIAHVNLKGALKARSGNWTFELLPVLAIGRASTSRYAKLRTVTTAPGAPATVNAENGTDTLLDKRGWLDTKVTYALDPRTSLSLDTTAGGAGGIWRDERHFTGLTPDFTSFDAHQHAASGSGFYEFTLALDHKGHREGETLTASGSLGRELGYHRRTDTTIVSADPTASGAYAIDASGAFDFARAQADWQHPLAGRRLLSLGVKWDRTAIAPGYVFTGTTALAALGPDVATGYAGARSTLAAYATLQAPLGNWMLMPGLRYERSAWQVAATGQPPTRHAEGALFPTVHVDHPLGKAFQLTLSYSRRIDRASLDLLQPYPVITDALAITVGNPALRDQSTDSYELNLHFHRGAVDAGMIVYDRETRQAWNQVFGVNAQGLNVGTTINAGLRSDRGAEFDATLPLARRVKLTTSVNLFASRVPVDGLAGRQSTFRTTTNSTLEWDGPQHGKCPGDVLQLQFQLESPYRDYQMHQDTTHALTLAWTHSFATGLSVTATAQNLGWPVHLRHELAAPLVQETYDERRTPDVAIKLLKTFGGN